MDKNWDAFFHMLIEHEGGFTDDPRDSGNKRGDGHGNAGSTMLGVTAHVWAEYTGKPAPKDVMRALTEKDVKPLYKRNYWDAVHADKLPSGVDVSVADLCVNAGPHRAAKILQRCVGAKADGAVGPMTLRAVHDVEPNKLLGLYYEQRESFYRRLKDYAIYGKGWSRRNKETLERAKELLDA